MTRERTEHVHFLGIGGAGLSPLAQIHLAGGGTVSGSDAEESPRVAALRARGVPVRVGPPANEDARSAELTGVDVVVASSALPDDHPDIRAARALGLPVRRRSEWLPELTAGHRLVAVAGSHGKSTTSAMLALVLRAAGLDPTAVIGAEVSQLGGNALTGAGDVFVLESDEYGGAFAGLEPALAVITNVEWEHPDIFPDAAAVQAVFASFARRLRPGGRLVVCGDDPGVAAVLADLRRNPGPAGADVTVLDYGFAAGRLWRAIPAPPAGIDALAPGADDLPLPGLDETTRATVVRAGEPVGTLTLAVPGQHSILNALAVLAVATELGVDPDQALATLATYTGAARRFEFVGFWRAAMTTGLPPALTDVLAASALPPPATPLGTSSAHAPAFAATPGTAALPGSSADADPSGAHSLEIIDDYAHHPTEIRLTLAAARTRARTREVWAVMQPHTYSRFAAMLDDFAEAFSDADRLYVTDVYAARERDDLGCHPADLVSRVRHPAFAVHVPWPELVERLAADVHAALSDAVPAVTAPAGPGDGATEAVETVRRSAHGILLLTLGAGTITTAGPRLLAALAPVPHPAPSVR